MPAGLMLGMVSGLDRKNCWTIAEHRGHATPDGLQHLLSRAKWDADAVRDDLRDYVIDAFGDPDAVLVVDETGDVKKGTDTVGVQRQYTRHRRADRELPGGGVFDLCRATRARADRPRACICRKSWAEDPDRCADAGIPDRQRGFRDQTRVGQDVDQPRRRCRQVPAAWVAGDEVYGADPELRASRARPRAGLCVGRLGQPPRPHPSRADPRRRTARPCCPAWAWQKHSAGAGSHGQRSTPGRGSPCCAEDDADTGRHHLLIRRNDRTGELAYLRCYSPRPVTLHALVPSPGNAGASRNPSKPPKA